MRIICFSVLLIVNLTCLLPGAALHAGAMGRKDKQVGQGLYFYSLKDLTQFLAKIGYRDFPIKASWDVRRNGDGSALRFFDWSNNKAIIVSRDGSVEGVDLPGMATWSRRPLWFNSANQVVAWIEEDRVHYASEITGTGEPQVANVDEPFGQYYLRDIQPKGRPNVMVGTTAICSMKMPGVSLAELDLIGKRLFAKDERVVLFGNTHQEREKQVEIHLLERRGPKLVQLARQSVKRPSRSPSSFNVEDMSPWSEDVLFCDVYDFPSRSRWYVYNLETKKMKLMGHKPFSGGWGFYLQCDVLNKALEKLKTKYQ